MAAPDGNLPAPVRAWGPYAALGLRVHGLLNVGRCAEALAAAEAYEALASAVGDEKTVLFLWQSRMYVLQLLGRHEQALAVGDQLVLRRRAEGNPVEEAKTLADLSWTLMVTGQIVAAMRYLARSAILLEQIEPHGDRYVSAVSSYGATAFVAELYEEANSAYERAGRLAPPGSGDTPGVNHIEVLLRWGLRLDQLGERGQATRRLTGCVERARRWLSGYPGDDGMRLRVLSYQALALAKLGAYDEAVRLAGPLVLPLRADGLDDEARLAHLALGVGLSGLGDPAAAGRELLAAHQLLRVDSTVDDRLFIARERAVLALHGMDGTVARTVLDAIGEQARQLWQVRLQRLAMLRQAMEREALEAEHARTESALLRDPLTGLGNRLRFDRIMAAVDAGSWDRPTSLLVLDVDRFKAINDTYSHAAGDEILCAIAGVLRASCRTEQDVAVRYAGDEFAVFLQGTTAAAVDVADRIMSAVRTTDVRHVAPGLRLSVSIGVASLAPGMTARELFRAADAQMYRSKRAGRGRVSADGSA